MKRKLMKSFGLRGGRRANLYKQGARWVVERYVGGKPRRKSFASRPEAEAYATAYAMASTSPAVEVLTLRQAIDRWMNVEGPKAEWRGATAINYANHWKRITQILLPDSPVASIGKAHLDHLWLTLKGDGAAHRQTVAKVNLLKRLMAWLADRDLAPNKVASWMAPKKPVERVPEFAPAQTEAILAQWDYQRSGWHWRPWAVTMIAQTHGVRANALLHLEWSDIDWESMTIRLRQELDKTKKAWERTLTWDAYAALLTAKYHAARLGHTSRFVFYGNAVKRGDRPYTYSAYHSALLEAEKRAKVEHVRLRAAHGFRRQAVNDARKATGDASLGLLWVNDTDLRQSQSYVRAREDELAALSERRADHTSTVSGGDRGRD